MIHRVIEMLKWFLKASGNPSNIPPGYPESAAAGAERRLGSLVIILFGCS
jgi:hypothetical protein